MIINKNNVYSRLCFYNRRVKNSLLFMKTVLFLFFFFVLGTFIYFKLLISVNQREEAPTTAFVEEYEIQTEP